MSILGLDIGEKRTGLAISNEISSICTPLNYIKSESLEYFMNEVSKIILENNINKIVIGLPILMNGKEGDRAKFSRKISTIMKSKYDSIKIILWDERLTSKQAEKYLKETNINKNKIKDKIDSASAVLLLENYIETVKKL